MRAFETPLPIDEALPRLAEALRTNPNAVLVAPPGAGKTTRVPLALVHEPWTRGGKLLVLEPRRLAARAAATRMAATLEEPVGATVGFRVRLEAKVSKATRIEVVTEGVFTRLILDDPTLDGIAAVLFDEFHERSLDADLGLALALDAQEALRPDLRLLPMSATLDGARVAALLGGAPVIESAGRSFPVETRHVGRDPARRIEDEMAAVALRALASESGSLLMFLPGQREIERTAALLAERVGDPAVLIAPLYGAMDPRDQDRAIAPARPGERKIVLATSIAETSLTIEGVRVVIDSGLARVPRFEPDVGVTRLETVRVSRAAADQRRGRAGRTQPGVCYRLWEEAATGALEAFQKPEILASDLSPLILDCAAFGVTDPRALRFLDQPPISALNEGRALLLALGALDADGRLTATGRRLSALALPPRLARMVVEAADRGKGETAAQVAALLGERGLGGDAIDLTERLDRFRRDRSARAEATRRLAKGWARLAGAPGNDDDGDTSLGPLLALAFPDRVAVARGRPGAFTMENGRGVVVEPHERIAREPFIVVADITGVAAGARLLAAVPISRAEIEALSGFGRRREALFDKAAGALRARDVVAYRRLVLAEAPAPLDLDEGAARALARGLAGLGLARLPWSRAQSQLRERVGFLRAVDPENWPDLSDAALAANAEDWLAPLILGRRSLAEIDAGVLDAALASLLPWPLPRRLDDEAPTHFTAPTGSRLAIDYAAEAGPTISVRVQELYGLTKHPTVAGGRIALVLELLSPAQRPIQITRDLPGFWRGSWSDVKSDMRGRYPRHLWPDDPTEAMATTRAKPRGT